MAAALLDLWSTSLNLRWIGPQAPVVPQARWPVAAARPTIGRAWRDSRGRNQCFPDLPVSSGPEDSLVMVLLEQLQAANIPGLQLEDRFLLVQCPFLGQGVLIFSLQHIFVATRQKVHL